MMIWGNGTFSDLLDILDNSQTLSLYMWTYFYNESVALNINSQLANITKDLISVHTKL